MALNESKPMDILHSSIQTTFGGRILSSEQSRLQLYGKWFQLCQSQHGSRCAVSKFPQLDASFTHPLLLIDVQKKLVTNATPDYRYVALSYVWGRTKNTQLTSKNLKHFMTVGIPGDIPRTIQDAMLVVDAVGERFLWVDSLCIIQDETTHKQAQIAQMANIFSNSVFTIVAAAGQDAHVGLWPSLKTEIYQQSVLRIGRHTLIELLDQSYKSSESHWEQDRKPSVSKYAWESRGWTFQEILCSRRAMVFTPVQAYWHCQERDWLEETALEYAPPCALRFHTGPTETAVHFWSPNFNQFFKDADAMLPQYFRSIEDALVCYVKLVTEYTKRYLTNPSDGLNAFSGAVSVMQGLMGRDFFWGLPEVEFGWALAWSAPDWELHSTNRSLTRPDASDSLRRTGTPSWSWASWYLDVPSEKYVWFNECDPFWPSLPLPEIYFYRKGRDGTLVLIRQRNIKDIGIPRPYTELTVYTNGTEWYSSSDWKGQPTHIDSAITTGAPNGFVDTGIIQFWTSTATLVVHRLFVGSGMSPASRAIAESTT
ncbi:HET-domain-containing protein [Rhizodiscina lignyota]|uniref:HET-domain-containing protein n=1 Tax=Rhizodiscina lignyota TaxID=1504668 RepID=A0A9P4IRR0_9PEZI|nr:HET-domain-containing protein [Rhizodiscina lignyota]